MHWAYVSYTQNTATMENHGPDTVVSSPELEKDCHSLPEDLYRAVLAL